MTTTEDDATKLDDEAIPRLPRSINAGDTKTVSNQWLSACIVNNSDEIGQPGRWFPHRVKFLL